MVAVTDDAVGAPRHERHVEGIQHESRSCDAVRAQTPSLALQGFGPRERGRPGAPEILVDTVFGFEASRIPSPYKGEVSSATLAS